MRHWIVFFATLSASPAAFADNLSEYFGPRELAVGESMRGASTEGSSTLLNPAGLSLTNQVVFEGTFGLRRGTDGIAGNVVACDSTVIIPGCYYYRYFDQELELGGDTFERRTHEFGMTLSRALTPKVHLGVTGRYFDYETDLDGGSADSGFGFDAGLVIAPHQMFRVGAVGYNLVSADSTQYPRAVGGGVVLSPTPMLRLGFDGVWDIETDAAGGRFSGGAEFVVSTPSNGFPLRAGAVHDTGDDATYVTGGLGYRNFRVGLDLGVSKQVNGGDDLVVLAGLRVFGPSGVPNQ